jgi:outer membrane protease
VRTIHPLLFACLRLGLALPASLCFAGPARAGDWSYRAFEAPSTYAGEVGLRFWYGKGKTGKDLYDSSGTSLVSRLTYDHLSIFAGEAYGRFDFNTGWFLKGYVGGGGFRNATLKDEDFPPGVAPYSVTTSVLNQSFPFYGSVDAGYDIIRGPDFRVGAFAGYHYLHEVTTAYGCSQLASNADICGIFPVPGTIKGITQDNNWNALRVGLDGTLNVTDRFKLSVDAAWLPRVWLQGSDAHWLRIDNYPGDFTGPIPEDGTGWGYQIDGFASYRVTDALSIGVGGRYWHMQTSGMTHFEGHVVGYMASPQPVDWKADNYGVFFQTSLKFGPYSVIGRN